MNWITIFFLFFMPLSTWISASGSAQADTDLNTFSGPTFYPFDQTNETMPPGWEEKEIRHPTEFAKADLVVTLGQHLYPVAKPLVDSYAKSNGLVIVVQEGTCGVSTGMLYKKQSDLSSFCCPPTPSDRLPDLVFHTIGIIPSVFIVHPDNPITNITHKEAKKLYSGDIEFWSELQDPAAKKYKHPVNLNTRLHCKLRPGHWRSLLDNEDQFAPMIQNAGSIPDMVDRVAADPKAIGWVARWMLSYNDNNKRLKMLSLDGVHPDDVEAVISGRFPFYKFLNIALWSGRHSNTIAQDLLKNLKDNLDTFDPKQHIITVDRLRKAGWRFQGEEIIGEPSQ